MLAERDDERSAACAVYFEVLWARPVCVWPCLHVACYACVARLGGSGALAGRDAALACPCCRRRARRRDIATFLAGDDDAG